MKFVRVIKTWGKKSEYKDKYDGILISKSKDEVEILGVGPEKNDNITTHYFEPSEVRIIEADKADVEHYFKLSILKSENALNDCEFALLDARRKVETANAVYKKYIGKEPTFT